MRFQPMRLISSLLATVLTAALLVVGAPTASNAEGVGNYLYKCNSYGTTIVTYTIPKGTPLKTCDNAQIEVYLNGSIVDRYYTDNNGMKNHYKWLSGGELVQCLFAVGSTVFGVRTSAGWKRIVNLAIGAAGIPACKA